MEYNAFIPPFLDEGQFGLFEYVEPDGVPTTSEQTSDQLPDEWIHYDLSLNNDFAIRWNSQLETENTGTSLQRDFQPFEPWSFFGPTNFDNNIYDDFASSINMEHSSSLYSDSQSSPAVAEQQLPSNSSSVSGSSPSSRSDQLASSSEESPIESQNTAIHTTEFTCGHCARSFTKKHLRTKHEQIHTRPIACPLAPTCQHRTARNRDMRRHIAVHHAGAVPRFMCSVSGCRYEQVGFNRKDNLTRHMRKVHSRLIP